MKRTRSPHLLLHLRSSRNQPKNQHFQGRNEAMIASTLYKGGVPQTAPSYELSRKYPRYWGSPKMNIFRIRNETMIATTPHQGGPADRLLIWALSEIPPILGFTKNDTFSNKENFVWLVLGCINDFLSFVFSSGRRARWASPERQIQPKKQISAGGENRGRRARALESL